MAHGGKRAGAGRKPGSPNKKTQEQISAVEDSGITPLEYMLTVMRDEGREQSERLDAAKAAAPYVHPKLSAVHSTEGDGKSFEDWLDDLDTDSSENSETEG